MYSHVQMLVLILMYAKDAFKTISLGCIWCQLKCNKYKNHVILDMQLTALVNISVFMFVSF